MCTPPRTIFRIVSKSSIACAVVVALFLSFLVTGIVLHTQKNINIKNINAATENGWHYYVRSDASGSPFYNTVWINGHDTKTGNVVIPDTLGGLPVTGISSGSLHTNTFTNITFPASLRIIDVFALAHSTALQTVTFQSSPGTLQILAKAFAYSPQLTTLTIPSTGQVMFGDDAFTGCSSLTRVVHTDNQIRYIGQNAFASTSLSSVEHLFTHTNIFLSDQAFRDMRSLDSLNIPYTVRSIPPWAFSGNAITDLTITNGVMHIEHNAFNNNPNMGAVTIPRSVTYIGGLAFENTGSHPIYINRHITEQNQITFASTTWNGGRPVIWNGILGTNKNDLNNLISQVEELDPNEHYGWNIIENVLKQAKAVSADSGASQQVVDNIEMALRYAMDGLLANQIVIDALQYQIDELRNDLTDLGNGLNNKIKLLQLENDILYETRTILMNTIEVLLETIKTGNSSELATVIENLMKQIEDLQAEIESISGDKTAILQLVEDLEKLLKELEEEMLYLIDNDTFEIIASLREQITELEAELEAERAKETLPGTGTLPSPSKDDNSNKFDPMIFIIIGTGGVTFIIGIIVGILIHRSRERKRILAQDCRIPIG